MGFPRLFLFSGAVLPGENHYHHQGWGAWWLWRYAGPGPDSFFAKKYSWRTEHRHRKHAWRRGHESGEPHLFIRQARRTRDRLGGDADYHRPAPRHGGGEVRPRQTHFSRLYG